MKTQGVLIFFFLFAFSLPAFADHQAQADLLKPDGTKVGIAHFTQTGETVKIALDLSGLTAGEHAIHIHSVGKCEGPDFATAGPHFNPFHKKHGVQSTDGSHAGDLPNITAAADGSVKTEITASEVTLEEGVENSLFQADGTSIVIHAGPDDNVTDPAGNSGGRILCGVVQKIE